MLTSTEDRREVYNMIETLSFELGRYYWEVRVPSLNRTNSIRLAIDEKDREFFKYVKNKGKVEACCELLGLDFNTVEKLGQMKYFDIKRKTSTPNPAPF